MTILTVAETPTFFSGLLPSKMTIARFAAEPRDRAQLRKAEAKGAFYSILLGVGASILSDSPMPAVGAALMSAFLILTDYEPSIRDSMTNPDATPIDQQGDVRQIPVAVGGRFRLPKRWSFANTGGNYISN